MTRRICIVIPYFGHWPFWMTVFLESCRHNPTIDWRLYTDCPPLQHLPDNVTVVSTSFGEYCKKISARLGINFYPSHPYKLCDIKPALGHIHSEELTEYDFWGFGDLDVVYGNLRNYFTADRLEHWDIFSTHARRISGHLCLMRNSPEMKVAFQKVKGWQSMLERDEHLAFDEKSFSKVFLRHKNSAAIFRWLAAKLDPWLTRAEFNEAYTTPNAKIKWRNNTHQYPQEWYWQAGKVTNSLDTGYEFPYFHFMAWKKDWRQHELIAWDQLRSASAVEISRDGFRLI